jgi:hypothetical protein
MTALSIVGIRFSWHCNDDLCLVIRDSWVYILRVKVTTKCGRRDVFLLMSVEIWRGVTSVVLIGEK